MCYRIVCNIHKILLTDLNLTHASRQNEEEEEEKKTCFMHFILFTLKQLCYVFIKQ